MSTLQILPRKERTVWRTRDRRIYFRRQQGGWVVKCYRVEDQVTERLIEAGLMHPDSTCPIAFSSLSEVMEVTRSVLEEVDPPVDFRLSQHHVAYEIVWNSKTVATVGRHTAEVDAFWKIEMCPAALPDRLQEFYLSEAYDYRRWTFFSTRAAAVQALERWLDTGIVPEIPARYSQ